MKKKRKTTAAGKRSGSRKTAKSAKGRAKPKAARAAGAKARATKTPVRKAAAVAKSAPGDSLDHFINAAASALDLPIDPAWMPAIKTNLEVTLRFAKQVTAFPLPDESEPAPVFVA